MWLWIPLVIALEASAQTVPAPRPVAPAPAPAPVGGPSLVERIEARYAKVQTLRMAFTQTVKSPLYGDQSQTGTVAFARPGKMRWQFSEEHKQYISDGSTMWMVLEQDKQVWRYANWDPAGSPESLLHSLDHLDELFSIVTQTSTAEGHVLKLFPVAEGGVVNVLLELSPDLDVRKVTLIDSMDTRTELVFTAVEVGVALPPETFTYTPPAGIEVIDASLPTGSPAPQDSP